MTSFNACAGLLLLAALSTAITAPLPAQQATPSYDVVVIKPNKSGPGNVDISIDDDRYQGENVTLKILIQYAYALKTEEQISGLSGWASSAGFDINAKMDSDSLAQLKALASEARTAKQRTMMQALLADRFRLKFHHETREMQTYALVTAKTGSKLTPSDPTDGHPNGIAWPDGGSHAGRISAHDNMLMAQGITMTGFANNLSSRLHRLVEDKTGLPGRYDFTLHFTRENAPAEPADDAPPLFTALQQQLGLKLEAARGPVDTIVVDHVEQPSEN